MIRTISAAALTVLILVAGPANAAAPKRHEPLPSPPQFHVDGPTRTINLQRVVNMVREGSVIGKYFVGITCFTSTIPIYVNDALGGVKPLDFIGLFTQEGIAAGYNIPGNQGVLFGTQEDGKLELAVGAAILEINAGGCKVGGTTEATIKVDWQIFDPLEKKLLFRVTNEGSATIGNSGIALQNRPAEAVREAFRQAAKAILADPNFAASARDPAANASDNLSATFSEKYTKNNKQIQIARVRPNTEAFKDQAALLRKQVVTVRTAAGTGSGFYVTDSLLLTDNHVVTSASHVRIRFFGGREIAGEVVASDIKRDVALIRTESAGVTGLPLRLESPNLTSQVFVIGSPLGEANEGSVTSGIVSAFRTEKEGSFIQSDVGVTHGNSGGPMFDDKGNVIAMTEGGHEGTAINLFIPIADAIRALNITFTP